jgi:hypothetical protein
MQRLSVFGGVENMAEIDGVHVLTGKDSCLGIVGG